MLKTMNATFDGKVLRPDIPIKIKPNTRVRITIETFNEKSKTRSFLHTAQSLKLDGPPDWSDQLEEYLYGKEGTHSE